MAGTIAVARAVSDKRFSDDLLALVTDNLKATKPSGFGLGLAICRSIIEAHGGRLWARANVPCGTKFQFTVPARPDISS
jgi:signal transduction histidine kinase